MESPAYMILVMHSSTLLGSQPINFTPLSHFSAGLPPCTVQMPWCSPKITPLHNILFTFPSFCSHFPRKNTTLIESNIHPLVPAPEQLDVAREKPTLVLNLKSLQPCPSGLYVVLVKPLSSTLFQWLLHIYIYILWYQTYISHISPSHS